MTNFSMCGGLSRFQGSVFCRVSPIAPQHLPLVVLSEVGSRAIFHVLNNNKVQQIITGILSMTRNDNDNAIQN